jgi:hypothetical protein
MKRYITILLLSVFATSYSFKFGMNLRNNNLPLDRKLYAKYLIDTRRSQKIIKTQSETLVRFINQTKETIEKTKLELDTEESKIKNIIIGDSIYLDIEGIKEIKIIAKEDKLTIELDKEKKSNKILKDVEQLSRNIKELDYLLSLLDIILTIYK